MDGGLLVLHSTHEYEKLRSCEASDILNVLFRGCVTITQNFPRINGIWSKSKIPPVGLTRRALHFRQRERLRNLMQTRPEFKNPVSSSIVKCGADQTDWTECCFAMDFDCGNAPFDQNRIVRYMNRIQKILIKYNIPKEHTTLIVSIANENGKLGMHVNGPDITLYPEELYELTLAIIADFEENEKLLGNVKWHKIIDMICWGSLREIGFQKSTRCPKCKGHSDYIKTCRECMTMGFIYVGRRYWVHMKIDPNGMEDKKGLLWWWKILNTILTMHYDQEVLIQENNRQMIELMEKFKLPPQSFKPSNFQKVQSKSSNHSNSNPNTNSNFSLFHHNYFPITPKIKQEPTETKIYDQPKSRDLDPHYYQKNGVMLSLYTQECEPYHQERFLIAIKQILKITNFRIPTQKHAPFKPPIDKIEPILLNITINNYFDSVIAAFDAHNEKCATNLSIVTSPGWNPTGISGMTGIKMITDIETGEVTYETKDKLLGNNSTKNRKRKNMEMDSKSTKVVTKFVENWKEYRDDVDFSQFTKRDQAAWNKQYGQFEKSRPVDRYIKNSDGNLIPDKMHRLKSVQEYIRNYYSHLPNNPYAKIMVKNVPPAPKTGNTSIITDTQFCQIKNGIHHRAPITFHINRYDGNLSQTCFHSQCRGKRFELVHD